VRITHSFFIGAHEVTVGQFRQFAEESGYRTEPESDGAGGYGIDLKTGEWSTKRDPRYSWRFVGFP
jgi:formylglycine-generating enzyme required for sulfatase activity